MEKINKIKKYLKNQIEIQKSFLKIGEGTLPLRNILAHDEKILALLEGKSMEEACKIQEERMNE